MVMVKKLANASLIGRNLPWHPVLLTRMLSALRYLVIHLLQRLLSPADFVG